MIFLKSSQTMIKKSVELQDLLTVKIELYENENK